jgi:hypothetical protein
MVRHNVPGLGRREGREAIEHLSLAGDATGKDMIEDKDTIRGNHNKHVAKVVSIPHLPPAKEGAGQIRFQQNPHPILNPGEGKYHPRV